MPIGVMLLANPPEKKNPKKPKAKGKPKSDKKPPKTNKKKEASMAAKKDKKPKSGTKKPGKKTNPPKQEKTTSGRRGSRRRRNDKKDVSAGSVILGVVLGGLTSGVMDYGLAGMEMTATPTKRAVIHGTLAVATGVGAAMTEGTARGVLAGTAGAFAGNAAAQGTRAVALAIADSGDKKATKDKKPDATKPNADAAMSALVERAGGPARLNAPRKSSMRATTLDRMRALVQRA